VRLEPFYELFCAYTRIPWDPWTSPSYLECVWCTSLFCYLLHDARFSGHGTLPPNSEYACASSVNSTIGTAAISVKILAPLRETVVFGSLDSSILTGLVLTVATHLAQGQTIHSVTSRTTSRFTLGACRGTYASIAHRYVLLSRLFQ
jgi:uncharacterized membrane protein